MEREFSSAHGKIMTITNLIALDAGNGSTQKNMSGANNGKITVYESRR